MKRNRQLRLLIAVEAAKLITSGRETEFTTAKRKAARTLGVRFTVRDFPSVREIENACRRLTGLSRSSSRLPTARQLRVAALRWMRQLRPRDVLLLSPGVDQAIETGLETSIAIISDDLDGVRRDLEQQSPDVVLVDEWNMPDGTGRNGIFLLPGEPTIKVVVMPASAERPKGEATDIVEQSLNLDADDLDQELEGIDPSADRFLVIEDLLQGLERIRLDRADHPEGDALHHALQLFDETLRERPYDEELLTAVLLHDVDLLGGGPSDSVDQSELLDRLVTHRTMRLIEAIQYATREPTACERGIRDLVPKEDVDDVQLVAEWDRRAREPGRPTISAADAVDYLRRLEAGTDWDRDHS